MGTAAALSLAATFVWCGMVLAISFLEAPLKFRAPGVTVPIGLGIGRLVFRALNGCEVVLAALVVIGLAVDPPATWVWIALGAAVVVLLAQLALVRPRLARRSDAVLAGTAPEDAPRSHAHLWYVGTETVKVACLLAGGCGLLAR